jgi:hypothetical protein
MERLESIAYKNLNKKDLFSVDKIRIGSEYKVLNYDGQTYSDLGKCLNNTYTETIFPRYINDFTYTPESRVLEFEYDYPTKNDIISMIKKNPLNAKIPIFPILESDYEAETASLSMIKENPLPLESDYKAETAPLPMIKENHMQDLTPPAPPTKSDIGDTTQILNAVRGRYVKNEKNDNYIVTAYNETKTKTEFLKKTDFPPGINKYTLAPVFFNGEDKITFARGMYKRKNHKQKSHKRKRHKQKSHKQKSHKKHY